MLRDAFYIADPDLCYLDGNSLGRLPRAAAERLAQVIEAGWGTELIGGWNADWIHLPRRIGSKISALIGGRADETVVADSTSVNLFKLATAALRAHSSGRVIVTDATNFPSDLYILNSAMQAAGERFEIRNVGQPLDIELPADEVIAAIGPETALVCLSHVTFRSGYLHDMCEISAAAHAVGALVLWDLSHSVGAVPVDLRASQVDLAVGCTYKYLCGGPGAPAFIYVRQELQQQLDNPLAGWFSHRQPFQFDPAYAAADSIDRFLTGTPPILSLAAIEAGGDLVAAAGVEQLRGISLELTTRLVEHFDRRLRGLGFELRSPRSAERRGSHIALGHPEARRITANLIERHQVVPDFRAPDNLRLGVAPLYTTAAEIDRAVQAIVQTGERREFETIRVSDASVT